MKKIVTIMIIAIVALTSVFAATKVGAPDYVFTGKAGWERISGVDAVTGNVAVSRDFFFGDQFKIGALVDGGVAIFASEEGARFTGFIAPTFTFDGIEESVELVVAPGVKLVNYVDFSDWGVGGEVLLTHWVKPGCGITLGFDATRLIKSHTNAYGVTLGISCQL